MASEVNYCGVLAVQSLSPNRIVPFLKWTDVTLGRCSKLRPRKWIVIWNINSYIYEHRQNFRFSKTYKHNEPNCSHNAPEIKYNGPGEMRENQSGHIKWNEESNLENYGCLSEKFVFYWIFWKLPVHHQEQTMQVYLFLSLEPNTQVKQI